MKVIFSEELETEMNRHLCDCYPDEGCGLLVGHASDPKEIVRIDPAPNTKGENRARRYLIDPGFFAKREREVQAEDLEILGIYHSHPDHPSRPSDFDRDHAWPWYSYIIVSIEKGVARKVTSWRLRDDRSRFDEEKIERTQK